MHPNQIRIYLSLDLLWQFRTPSRIIRAWIIDENRVIVLEEVQGSAIASYSTLKIYAKSPERSESATRIESYVIGINVRDVHVAKEGILMHSATSNGTLTLHTWRSKYRLRCVLQMHVGDARVLGLGDDAKWFGYATDKDVRVMRYEGAEALSSTLASSVFEYGGCTGYEIKDNFVEMRFSRDTGEALPGSAMDTMASTIVDSAPQAQATTWFSRGSPMRRKKKHIPFEIVGETPIVDHPTILNASCASFCHNFIHKRLEIDEKPVGIHFMRRPDMHHGHTTRCIISTSNKAYVYDMDTLQLVTQFEYGGECLTSATNSYLLFALNPAGLEVWSVMGNGCLLRAQTFIGLKQIAVTNQTVMLLSQFSNEENLALAVFSGEAGQSSSNSSTGPMIMSDMRHIDKIAGEKGRLLPIFSGGRRRAAQNSTAPKEYNYNIYILSLVEMCDLYDDLLEIAQDKKESQPEKRVEIIEEAHSLLQCKCDELTTQQAQIPEGDILEVIRLKLEIANYSMLLERSFGFLGDVYMENRIFDRAAECYVQSKRSVRDVVQLYVTHNAQAHLITFLNVILFDKSQSAVCQSESDTNAVNVELGNRILNVYRQFEPHTLSKVLLESNLHKYDENLAIEYMLEQGAPSSEEESREYSGYRPRDAFVLGLLFLKKGLVEKAVAAFSNELSVLIDFCVMNASLFETDLDERTNGTIRETVPVFNAPAYKQNSDQVSFAYTSTPSLGIVLRAYFPWCLLQILCMLRSNLTWQQGLRLLFASPNQSQNRLLGELYLRYCLSQEKVSRERKHIAEVLFFFFVDDLKEDYSGTEWQQNNEQQRGGFLHSLAELESLLCWTPKSLITKRFQWLNSIFPASITPPQEVAAIQHQLHHSTSDDSLAEKFFQRLTTDAPFRKSFALLNAEGLQNATDSPLPRTSVCNRLELMPDFEGKLSLQLVAYANTKQWGKMFVLLTSPENGTLARPRIRMLVKLAKAFCTKLEDWRALINLLLLREDINSRKELRSTLEAVLDHVASEFSTEEFLSTLPKNGSAKFFLPFIKKSLRVAGGEVRV